MVLGTTFPYLQSSTAAKLTGKTSYLQGHPPIMSALAKVRDGTLCTWGVSCPIFDEQE